MTEDDFLKEHPLGIYFKDISCTCKQDITCARCALMEMIEKTQIDKQIIERDYIKKSEVENLCKSLCNQTAIAFDFIPKERVKEVIKEMISEPYWRVVGYEHKVGITPELFGRFITHLKEELGIDDVLFGMKIKEDKKLNKGEIEFRQD